MQIPENFADLCNGVLFGGKQVVKPEELEDNPTEVLKDKIFYENSGGGITLSGGEPLMQFEFALELLKTAKANGLHTCIETCGFAPKEKISEIQITEVGHLRTLTETFRG